MAAQRNIESLSRDELLNLVKALVEQNDELRAIIEELRRSGKRQAAPFSKGTRTKDRKRPGRKAGQGPFTHREAPTPDQVTEPAVDVPVDEEACPECGGELDPERTDFADQIEIPEVPKPIVTMYRIEVCRCRSCGIQVRGRHPEVAADQLGATAHRLGPRLLAWAHVLHHGIGVPVRRVPIILRQGHGVRVTQSAITQDALKRGAGVIGQRYEAIRSAVRDSLSV